MFYNKHLSNHFFKRVPLRSAIAVRVFLEIQFQSGDSFPGTVSDQAAWWFANYNTNGQSQTFISTVEAFENIACKLSNLRKK